MISTSQNVYIDKLDDIADKYHNTYHNTIKMKPVGVKSSWYIDFNEGNNREDPKFEIDAHVEISKYKIVFAKGYVPYWSDEVFVTKKVIWPNLFWSTTVLRGTNYLPYLKLDPLDLESWNFLYI